MTLKPSSGLPRTRATATTSRPIAPRFDKLAPNFLAALPLASVSLCTRHYEPMT